MSDILVTDTGFQPYASRPCLVLFASDVPETFHGRFDDKAEIHIQFDASADGRGFSLARRLRELGYQGRLMATGALVSDHYRHARQSGFDGVVITSEQAQKMPEAHWLEQARRVSLSYRERIYQ